MEQLQKLSNELTLRTIALNATVSKAVEGKEDCDITEYYENLHKLSCMSNDYVECIEQTLDRLMEVMQRFEDYVKGSRADY